METSADSWLGGKLTLLQPAKGHRVGSDAALLAAATPQAERIVDVGAGVGAVGLALLKRMTGARAELVEIDAELGALAAENVRKNDLAERARVIVADVTAARSRRGGHRNRSSVNGAGRQLCADHGPLRLSQLNLVVTNSTT